MSSYTHAVYKTREGVKADTLSRGFAYINTAFESATPVDWDRMPDGTVRVKLLYDHERSSENRASSNWYFQVQALPGSLVTLELDNFNNIWNGIHASAITDTSTCITSTDGRNWNTIPVKRIAGNRLRLQLRMDSSCMFVARLQPYSISDLDTLLASVRRHSMTQIQQIGKTVEGKPLEIVRLGSADASFNVFIRARAHGFESGGSWVVQGLINSLLKKDSANRDYLNRYCLYILPMANKDAVARGKSRFNAMGVDLNRGWGKPADPQYAPENAAIEKWLSAMIEQGKKPDLVIDLHNDGDGLLHLASSSEGSSYASNMTNLETLLRRHTWFAEGSTGGSKSGFRNPSSIAEAMLSRYGIDALVYELNYEWIRSKKKIPMGADWELLGKQLGKVLYEYAGMTKRSLLLDSTELVVEPIITGLEVPWEIAWGQDSCIWYTEQNGKISRVNPSTGKKKLLLQLTDMYRKRLGLMSMALHPDMKLFPYVFLNYTFLRDSLIFSKLVRYTYRDDSLQSPLVLAEWPGHAGHNGSRIVISPERKLVIATGDIVNEKNVQDTNTANGKILRLNMDGTIPEDNPYHNSPVWAKGFRVPQGLTFIPNGHLFSAEHGDATDDEVNLIRKGANYGWPTVAGYCDLPDEKKYCATHQVTEPLIAWTPTIAPAGMDYYKSNSIPEWKNALLLVTLKTQSLRVLKLNAAGTKLAGEKVYLEKQFGRLRDICVSPGGDVYISTSNRDWNPAEGFPVSTDDRILRIHAVRKIRKTKLTAKTFVTAKASTPASPSARGSIIYTGYCSSCHKSDGQGVPGTFPPLTGKGVTGNDKNALIRTVLKGVSGKHVINGIEYTQAMPAFGFLSDKELADVLSYIRTQFNKTSAITEADVRTAKKTK